MANTEFGTVFFDEISYTKFDGKAWTDTVFAPSNQLPIHPASHVLHYASTCFEGLKAFKNKNGKVLVFRLDDHIKRMQNSARKLHLPVPDAAQMRAMVLDLLAKYRDQVPEFPAAAYIRPTLIGLDEAIGRAAAPSQTALLFILISPVGDYISADAKVRVLLDTDNQRTAAHFGSVKTGGNYASALGLIQAARNKYQVEQVIFAPKGDVQETGATNCLLVNDKQIITKPTGDEFLPGITRDSLLKVAKKLGYEVIEKNINADELISFIANGELILSGTAAVLVPVSEVVYQDKNYPVNQGKPAANAKKLREHLTNIQQGIEEDKFNWITVI